MTDYWRRYTGARVSRRRLLASAGAVGAAACVLPIVGCSSGTKTPSGVASPGAAPTAASDRPDVLNPGGTPKRGGRYRYSVAADFGTWDPHIGIAVASAYFPRVYNVLVNQSSARPGLLLLRPGINVRESGRRDVHLQDPPGREDRAERPRRTRTCARRRGCAADHRAHRGDERGEQLHLRARLHREDSRVRRHA